MISSVEIIIHFLVGGEIRGEIQSPLSIICAKREISGFVSPHGENSHKRATYTYIPPPIALEMSSRTYSNKKIRKTVQTNWKKSKNVSGEIQTCFVSPHGDFGISPPPHSTSWKHCKYLEKSRNSMQTHMTRPPQHTQLPWKHSTTPNPGRAASELS